MAAEPTVSFVPKDKDAFILEEGGQRIGEMIVTTKDGVLSVYHTEVDQKHKGRGLGKLLVEAMSQHARCNHLKVDAHCPFVKAQFKENPELYADIVK